MKDLIVPRVDAVFGPANRRPFLLLKEEVARMPETSEVAAASEAEKTGLTAEEKDAIKAALGTLYPLYEENKIPGSIIAALGQLVGYPAPEGQPKGEGAYPQPYPGYKEVVKALEQLPNKEEVERLLQSVTKSIEDERKTYREEIEKANSKVIELEKALAQEREIRERREFESNIGGTLDSLAKHTGEGFIGQLFEIKKSMTDEKWAAFVETLKKLNELTKAVPIMKELGSSAKEESPEDILTARAKVLVEKGLAKTMEQARIKVLEEDRGLYKALRGR